MPGFGLYGAKIEQEDDDRYVVTELLPMGLAEQSGIETWDYVTGVDVEQVGRPPKEIIYPFALAVLGLVIALQLARWRRQRASENDTGA